MYITISMSDVRSAYLDLPSSVLGCSLSGVLPTSRGMLPVNRGGTIAYSRSAPPSNSPVRSAARTNERRKWTSSMGETAGLKARKNAYGGGMIVTDLA